MDWLPHIWGGKNKGRDRDRAAVKFRLFPVVQKSSAHFLTNMPILHMKDVNLLGRIVIYGLKKTCIPSPTQKYCRAAPLSLTRHVIIVHFPDVAA